MDIEKETAASPAAHWTDSHCHLTDEQFAGDVDGVLERAARAGVDRVVVVGDRLESSRESLALAKAIPERLAATAGVHPHHAGEWSDAEANTLRDIIREHAGTINRDFPLLAALGEIGLDFYYDFAPREKQIEAFLDQVEIARETGLPLVMHCRDAYEPFIALLRDHKVGDIGGVVHCFSGTPAEARQIVDMGLFIGIGGTLTFKKNDVGREVVRAVPSETLVIETDAPYLAPAPRRGRRNEPALLVHTARRLAEELEMEEAELARILDGNTRRLFRAKERALRKAP